MLWLPDIVANVMGECFVTVTIEEEDLGGLSGPRARAAAKFWKENWVWMVSRPGSGRYVVQRHWRGLLDTEVDKSDRWLVENTRHSIHEDVRFESESEAGELFGFAAFLNTRELRKVKSANSALAALGTSESPQKAYQLAPKLSQPKAWLSIGRRKPLVTPPKGVGATAGRWSKIFAVDWGTYRVGVARLHSLELFVKSAKSNGMRGRYLISLIGTPRGQRVWNISKPEDQSPIATRKDPEDFFAELRRKKQRYLVWSDGKAKPVVYDVKTEKPLRKGLPVRIVKQDLEKGLVYAEVLVPNETDSQGEFQKSDTVEEAAHGYLEKYMSEPHLDYRHDRVLDPDEAVLVESWIAPVSFEWNGRRIKEGTWLATVKLKSETLKKEVVTGELRSFSIRGLGTKKEGV